MDIVLNLSIAEIFHNPQDLVRETLWKSTFNDHKMSDAETERKSKVFTENVLRAST